MILSHFIPYQLAYQLKLKHNHTYAHTRTHNIDSILLRFSAYEHTVMKFKLKLSLWFAFYAALLFVLVYKRNAIFSSDPHISLYINQPNPCTTPSQPNSTQINRLKANRTHTPRVYCMILTKEDSVSTKAKATYDTWAHKCDNYSFVAKMTQQQEQEQHRSLSNTTSETAQIATSTNKHNLNLLDPPGLTEDSYDKLTDKVFLAIKHLHENTANYDWYLKADDDTFIFMDNLRSFLEDKNPSEPVTFGYDFKLFIEHGYHSGGAGYVLSSEAFGRLGSALVKNESYCENTGTEDTDVARCLRRLNVVPGVSLDEKGRERFHPFAIENQFAGDNPDWYNEYASNPIRQVCDVLFSRIFLITN